MTFITFFLQTFLIGIRYYNLETLNEKSKWDDGKANDLIIEYSKQSQVGYLFDKRLFHIKPDLFDF